MKILKVRPAAEQIERLIKSHYETLYLEKIEGIPRGEALEYHAKEIKDNLRRKEGFIVVDDKGNLYGMALFCDSEWDSKLLRCSVAKIDLIITTKNLPERENIYKKLISEVLSVCKKKRHKLIFMRSSLDNRLLNRSLARTGANPISILVNLYLSLKNRIAKSKFNNISGCQVRQPKGSEYHKIADLMAAGYENRLLYEPCLKENDVRNFYREWIINDLKGRVKGFLCAEFNGCLGGFIAFDELLVNKSKFAFIDMIVVDEALRNKGIGMLLVNSVMDELSRDTKGVLLGVELDKRQVLNFYLSLGFRVTDSSYTFHIYPG